MRTLGLLFFFLIMPLLCFSQAPQDYFNSGSQLYVESKPQEALQKIKEGLQRFPNDPKLQALADKLKEEEKEKKKEEQEKKEQQEQEKKEQQKKEEQQKKDDKTKSENKDEQSKKEEQKKEDQKKSEQEKETEKPSEEKKDTPPSVSEKLQQMKISEEKAKMLLEAMKNQEVQYLQQNKRKATKPKDKGKPDW